MVNSGLKWLRPYMTQAAKPAALLKQKLGHYFFFSVLDERAHEIKAAHYQKNVFFAQLAHWIVADFRKNS